MARVIDIVDVMMLGLVLIWGTAFVSLKVLGEVLDPFAIMWFRFLPFLLVFGAWLFLTKRQEMAAIPGKDWARFAVAGFLGVVGYHVPVNWALQPHTGVTAATGAVLVATTPLWTLLMAVAIRQEPLTRDKAIGTLVAFAGVVVVVLLGRGEAEFSAAMTASLILVAAILWSGYNIIGKPLVTKYGGMLTTAVSFSLGTLFLVPYGLWLGGAPLVDMEPRHWAWLIYIGLAGTVLGYVIWNHALSHRTASEVTSFIYLIPVVATIAGVIILGEGITLWFVGGAAMVIGGVAMVNRARQQAARVRAANA